MKKDTAQKILSELEMGYDLVSDKFSSTRAFMWRDLEFIKDYAKPGSRILDFGCGNGRLAEFLKEKYSEYVGVDVSQKLIDIAKQTYSSEKTEFIKINPKVIKLPFEDNNFDAIFSIAVFHHLPGKEYREKVVKELYRILKPGGKIIITVWDLWQKRFWKYHTEAVKNKILGRSELDWGDLHIPFKAGEEVFSRYHHAFCKRELKKMLQHSGFGIQGSIKSSGNLIYIASNRS